MPPIFVSSLEFQFNEKYGNMENPVSNFILQKDLFFFQLEPSCIAFHCVWLHISELAGLAIQNWQFI
jgi:hypothetical protein